MTIEITNERYPSGNRVLQRSTGYSLPLGQDLLESEDLISECGFVQHCKQLQVDGLHLSFFKRSQEEALETTVKSDGSYMQMHFEISGGAASYQPRDKKEKSLHTVGGQFTFFYVPQLDGRLADPACKPALSLEIEVDESWLTRNLIADCKTSEQFLNAIDRQQAVVLGGQSHRINPQMQRVIHEIYHCPYIGQVKRLHIEGKILMLLGLQLQQANAVVQRSKSVSITAGDRERLYALYEILSKNFSTNYALEELAQLTAMNRTKLQAGFKHLFGTTIHEFVVEGRMMEAYRLLTTIAADTLTIEALAHQVGYKHYNHFSVAFKKRFGYSPSCFLRTN